MGASHRPTCQQQFSHREKGGFNEAQPCWKLCCIFLCLFLLCVDTCSRLVQHGTLVVHMFFFFRDTIALDPQRKQRKVSSFRCPFAEMCVSFADVATQLRAASTQFLF